MSEFFFGIDTSNYTTSFAVCDDRGSIVLNAKKMLSVKEGERGLRQSDAVFLHTVNMEFVAGRVAEFMNERHDAVISSVGYSERPRDVEGSYMPCFLAGKGAAENIAASTRARSFAFSHQAGHIASALYGAGATELIGKRFAAFHVSGGTTDVLLVDGFCHGRFGVTRIGGTKDLNMGQIIDRVGVMMELPFPSGKYMESLSSEYSGKAVHYPDPVTGLECSLSGIENRASKLYNETRDRSLVASFVIKTLTKALKSLTDNLLTEYPDIPIVYSGGVMSCGEIKTALSGDGRYFAPPEFSSDNAAGIAYLAYLCRDLPQTE